MRRMVFLAGFPALFALSSCETTVKGMLTVRPGKTLHLVDDSGSVANLKGGEDGIRTPVNIELVAESASSEEITIRLKHGTKREAIDGSYPGSQVDRHLMGKTFSEDFLDRRVRIFTGGPGHIASFKVPKGDFGNFFRGMGERKKSLIDPEDSGQIHSITVFSGYERYYGDGYVVSVGPGMVFKNEDGEVVATFQSYGKF